METGPPPSQPLFNSAERNSHPPPPNLSCHGPGPIFKRVTWALLDCELHLGSSQEARHCLWWIACAKTKRLQVCSEEIKAARWLSVSARTFFFVFSPHYQLCSEMVSPASTELSRPTSPGNHWVTQDREQDPTSASQHNHHTRYSIKASSCTPTLFPKNLQKKHLLKEHPNTPLSHQEVVLITHKCFPPVWLLLPNERFYIYTVYVWMKPLRLDLTAAYRAVPDHGKSFKNRALKLWTSSMKKK